MGGSRETKKRVQESIQESIKRIGGQSQKQPHTIQPKRWLESICFISPHNNKIMPWKWLPFIFLCWAAPFLVSSKSIPIPRKDDNFIPLLRSHSEYFTVSLQNHSTTNHRQTLANIYHQLPSIINRLASTATPTDLELWLLEAAYIHTGNLKAALEITSNRIQPKVVTAAHLIDHSNRLLRLIQGNILQYLLFGPDRDHPQSLQARAIFINGCTLSSSSSPSTISSTKLKITNTLESIAPDRIHLSTASALTCQCLGDLATLTSWKHQNKLKSQPFNLFPIWRSKRYHELELSKMLWRASSVGLTCMIVPILNSAVSHPKSSSGKSGALSTVDHLVQRLPLEFAGVPLKGDEKNYKLGALGTAAVYGWSSIVQLMVSNFQCCVPSDIFNVVLHHVDSVFEAIMPIFVQGVPCKCVLDHQACSGSSGRAMVTSMKEAKQRRRQEAMKRTNNCPTMTPNDWTQNGGWQPEESSTEVVHHRCDIDSVHVNDISAETFLKDYVYSNKPIVIRGALRSTKPQEDIHAMFGKENLMQLLKGKKIHKSLIPYPKLFLKRERTTTLKKYFESSSINDGNQSTPDYIFVPCPAVLRHKISNVPPKVIDPLKSELWSGQSLCEFYAGQTNTGSPPHWHVLAMNFLMYGTKKWILAPPHLGFHSRTPANEHWQKYVHGKVGKEREGYLACTQRAGDLMLIPRFWSHSTLNSAISIGYALEFAATVPTTPTVKQPNK